MERVSLEGHRREGTGKGVVRKLRRAGQVPAVVYGRGITPTPITVEAKALRSALHTAAGMNVLIDLAIGDGVEGGRTVMVKELQRDIFRKDVIHVDFHTIDLTQKVETHVPLVFTVQAKGVVEDGGILETHLREIIVECLPTQIPEHIDVDISELLIGKSLHVSDLVMPGEVTLVTDPGEVIATVVAPKAEVVEAPAAVPEAAAAVPGTEAAAPAPEAKAEEKAKPGEEKKGE